MSWKEFYVSNGAEMHMFEESLIGTWEKNMPKMEMRRRWDKQPERTLFMVTSFVRNKDSMSPFLKDVVASLHNYGLNIRRESAHRPVVGCGCQPVGSLGFGRSKQTWKRKKKRTLQPPPSWSCLAVSLGQHRQVLHYCLSRDATYGHVKGQRHGLQSLQHHLSMYRNFWKKNSL